MKAERSLKFQRMELLPYRNLKHSMAATLGDTKWRSRGEAETLFRVAKEEAIVTTETLY